MKVTKDLWAASIGLKVRLLVAWGRGYWRMDVEQGLSFPLWVEMALPLFHCRRHSGGSELATLILGQTGPPTGRPVGFNRHLHAALGHQVRVLRLL